MLENLTAVDLSGCSGLESLPSSLCEVTKLVSLELRGCTSLTTLPEPKRAYVHAGMVQA